jgi:hypothetical protein
VDSQTHIGERICHGLGGHNDRRQQTVKFGPKILVTPIPSARITAPKADAVSAHPASVIATSGPDLAAEHPVGPGGIDQDQRDYATPLLLSGHGFGFLNGVRAAG